MPAHPLCTRRLADSDNGASALDMSSEGMQGMYNSYAAINATWYTI